jgi:hypothetical protein
MTIESETTEHASPHGRAEAIITHPFAQRRMRFARYIVTQTDLDVDAAIAMLEAAGEEEGDVYGPR